MARKSEIKPDILSKLREQEGRIGDTEKQAGMNRTLIIALIVVLAAAFIASFITIGAMLQSAIAQKTNTYQSLVDKVTEQSVKIDLLYELWSEIPKEITDDLTIIPVSDVSDCIEYVFGKKKIIFKE